MPAGCGAPHLRLVVVQAPTHLCLPRTGGITSKLDSASTNKHGVRTDLAILRRAVLLTQKNYRRRLSHYTGGDSFGRGDVDEALFEGVAAD